MLASINRLVRGVMGRVEGLLVRRDGHLTRELRQVQAPFGLGSLPLGMVPEATTRLVCGFCSVGCGLVAHLKGGHALQLTPARDYPVNPGTACPKGWEALTPLDSTDRGTMPLAKNSRGELEPVPWDDALTIFCSEIKKIQKNHGAEAVAFLGTGQMPLEELAFLGALGKFGMGMLHGDGNTRQCMATAVAAYKESFGFDAPPYTYADIEETDLAILVGANPCLTHPILWERCRRRKPGARLVVVDPRKTETASAADWHIPLALKGDLDFFQAVSAEILRLGAVDREFIRRHTQGFEAYEEHLRGLDRAATAKRAGVTEETVMQLARWIQEGKRVSIWWTMGVNQSHQGVRTAQALINLALMTGNIGRPGTGANSITGQCNAMGSRLFSNTASLLGGHDFTQPGHRARVGEVLGMDPRIFPDRQGKDYASIMEGIREGSIRGLWVVATNPVHSWIGQNDVKELLAKLDFLVVQDMYHSTETARMAHLYLPAAGWGEKEGTFINSERRIGRIKKVRQPPGEALDDFTIFQRIATAWGVSERFSRWYSPEAVFKLLREITRGRPCDITGIRDYDHLDEENGIQWPYPEVAPDKGPERRLFADGQFFTPEKTARFCFEPSHPLPMDTTGDFPLWLNTGRGSVAQWHTQTRTGKSPVLRKMHPWDPWMEIHPEDATVRGLNCGDWVTITSPGGEARARAMVTSAVPAGQVYLPMHGDDANRLTAAVFDPISKQPAYKGCAVQVEPAYLSPASAGSVKQAPGGVAG